MEVKELIEIVREEIQKCIKNINKRTDITKIRMFDCHNFVNGYMRVQILYQERGMRHPKFYANNVKYEK